MGLHPNTVVATELVSSINPTHIAVVQLDAELASDILDRTSLFQRFTVVVDVGDTCMDIMYTNFLSRHVVTTKLPLCRYLDSPC